MATTTTSKVAIDPAIERYLSAALADYRPVRAATSTEIGSCGPQGTPDVAVCPGLEWAVAAASREAMAQLMALRPPASLATVRDQLTKALDAWATAMGQRAKDIEGKNFNGPGLNDIEVALDAFCPPLTALDAAGKETILFPSLPGPGC